MSTTAEIIVYSGELIEGETIELQCSNPGDILFFKHPIKKFVAFTERNVKEDDGEYYFDESFGDVYQAIDADFVQVKKLVPGRLFAIFTYTDIYGQEYEISETFFVRPISDVISFSETTTGNVESLTFESTLLNVNATWTFNDNNGVLAGTNIKRTFNVDGYNTFTLNLDYSEATYIDGTPVVWETDPPKQISNTIISGGRSGIATTIDAYPVSTEIEDTFTVEYLAKKNLNSLMTLDVQVNSANFDGDINAPLMVTVVDKSAYSIDFNTDPDSIESVEIDFGDGEKTILFEVGFDFVKIYRRSGTYQGKYIVNTKHITTDSRVYRNTKEFEFTIIVEPFFSKWLRDNVNSKFYNSNQWYDLTEAWGTQTDRLYNEIQGLMESLDIENIDDKFLLSLAQTYGDFIDIYTKVGFTAFVDGRKNAFSYLKDYNIFERIQSGTMTDVEKQEFVNYIRTSRKRLQLKGTPASIERAISQFNMDATVEELWTDSFEPKIGHVIKDNIFAGDKYSPISGITHTGVSSPIADNSDQVVINADNTPYIEINTAEVSNIGYYTPNSELRIIDGIEYIVFPLNRPT